MVPDLRCLTLTMRTKFSAKKELCRDLEYWAYPPPPAPSLIDQIRKVVFDGLHCHQSSVCMEMGDMSTAWHPLG